MRGFMYRRTAGGNTQPLLILARKPVKLIIALDGGNPVGVRCVDG
jgi:hypothetical protein